MKPAQSAAPGKPAAKKTLAPAKSASAPVKRAPAPAPAPLVEPQDDEPTGVRWWWLAGGLAGAAVFAGSTLIALGRTLAGWELTVFRFINDWPEQLRWLFLALTMAPDSLWIAVATVILTFLLKMYRLAWQLAVATVGGYGIVYLAKHFVARARPPELVQDVAARVHDTDMGFPSGHAMIITVLVLVMLPYVSRRWRWVLLALIPLMALSRVYLGAHAPLDVVAGIAVGVVVVAGMRLLPKRWREVLHFH
jgi:membrane-associated phospholipid phosphatase